MLGEDGDFVPCLHSVGMPLVDGVEDVPWPCNADNKYIVHFPETREIWSFGSGYGGNALLGKKCFALRIASVMARDEGWLAEHMLILKLTSPEGKVKHVAGAFPSACGKTNLAMLIPTLEGWTVETVGDDIAWMKFGDDGRLYAINPEAGFFGVAPGTGEDTNPNAMATVRENIDLHQLRADRRRRRLVGGHDPRSAGARDRLAGPRLDARVRGAGRASERPLHDAGRPVPLDRAELGGPGGRADRRLPVRRPARVGRAAGARGLRLGARRLPRLDHGLREDGGGGRQGRRAALRPDGDAALLRLRHGALLRQHWLETGRREGAVLPKIFMVNWFRKDDDGNFLWPGFGENSRVLAWIFRRCDDEGEAVETPIGLVPAKDALDMSGLDLSDDALEQLLAVDPEEWKAQLPQVHEHFAQFGDTLPDELRAQLDALERRLTRLARPELEHPDGAPAAREAALDGRRAGVPEASAQEQRAMPGRREPAAHGPAGPRARAGVHRYALTEAAGSRRRPGSCPAWANTPVRMMWPPKAAGGACQRRGEGERRAGRRRARASLIASSAASLSPAGSQRRLRRDRRTRQASTNPQRTRRIRSSLSGLRG